MADDTSSGFDRPALAQMGVCGAVELSVFECPESVLRSALIINSGFDMA